MIIYKTTNLINGKIYIGQDSINRPKYYGSGNLIKLAIKKYGKENFKKETIEECVDIDDLNDAEIFWIWKLDSMVPKGYNLTEGGWGMLGYKHTNETKLKISKAHKGKKLSDEHKQNLSKNHADIKGKKHPMYGKHHSKEMRLKLSKSHMGQIAWNKGKYLSKSHKQNLSKSHIGQISPMKGKHHSEETKRKISEANKGKTPWNKGIPHSNETKLKMSKSSTKFNIPKDELYQFFIIEKRTQTKIAQMYGCTRGNIYRKLKQFGISKI